MNKHSSDMTKQEMEEYLGITKTQAEAEQHPLPVCPECGSKDINEVSAEYGDRGYRKWEGYMECQNCRETF